MRRLCQHALTPALAASMVLAGGSALAQGEGEGEQTRENRDREERPAERRGQRSAANAHYLAGYVDGYYDGREDLALELVDQQRRAGRERPREQRTREQQGARERIRRQLRERQGREQHARWTRGEVIARKQVAIRNTDVEHFVVLLKTEDGNRRVADLGPTDNFEDVDVQEGDAIEVRGHVALMGDKAIIAAHEVKVGDETIEVEFPKLDRGRRGERGSRAYRGERRRRPDDARGERPSQRRERSRDDE